MKTVTIKQGAMMPGTPHQVFELLMDNAKHAKFTGGEASISRKEGGSFSAFDGWATGTNMEIIKDKKIVQTWRGSDWPDGHYSIATFTLLSAKGGTKLLFSQTNVPSTFARDIANGWRQYYWAPMKELLSS
jgi:activator of HSP90 ATPase